MVRAMELTLLIALTIRRIRLGQLSRNVLIRKGMLYSLGHGDTAFTVPMFDEFLRRSREP